MKKVANTLVSIAVAGIVAGLAVPAAFAGDDHGHGHDKSGHDGCDGKDGCKGKASCEADTCKAADGKDTCRGHKK